MASLGIVELRSYSVLPNAANKSTGVVGMGMEVLPWHRRHALLLASQLPENPADARLVLQAITELVDTFIAKGEGMEPEKAANVLPFARG